MESIKKNKILYIVFVLVTVLFVWYLMSGSSVSTIVSLPEETQQSIAAGSKVLSTFNEVQSVVIDTELFKSTLWSSLIDLHVPVSNTPPGKVNLFAPIGGVTVAPSSTVKR
jgi:hypothetical protein